MIIVTGAKGQLGAEISEELEKRAIDHVGIDIADLDITDERAVFEFIDIYSPTCVIHSAAYTAVDKAEDEPEICHAVNVDGTINIAKACSAVGAQIVYISSDYVFDGKGDTEYETDSPKGPISTYGKSKLTGELEVQRFVPEKHYIIRTSWLFGKYGNNFVDTILRFSDIKDELSIVNDQIGSPTYAKDLAGLVCDIALSGKYGIYHATNEGFCSWAEFAEEILRIGRSGEVDSRSEDGSRREKSRKSSAYAKKCKILPIPTEMYPTKAQRPKNSRLSKKSLIDAGFVRLPTWQDALQRYMGEVKLK